MQHQEQITQLRLVAEVLQLEQEMPMVTMVVIQYLEVLQLQVVVAVVVTQRAVYQEDQVVVVAKVQAHLEDQEQQDKDMQVVVKMATTVVEAEAELMQKVSRPLEPQKLEMAAPVKLG
jgi:hypothetical protein